VRDSREAARRAQQEEKKDKKPAAVPAETVPATGEATPTDNEISEWAIVAAAFGEDEPAVPSPVTKMPPPSETTADDTAPSEEPTPAIDTTTSTASSETAPTVEIEETPKTEQETPVATVEPAKAGPRPLPPGHFRATPQMMSLVGCSEPEMADVLRGLGYRVLPPAEENGPHSFSVKPRFVREREEQRERQRLQEREQREQRRRERPERPNERQFFADGPARSGPARNEPGRDRPNREGPKPQGPRPDQAKGGPRDERSRDDRRGPRPPRRDSGGPALRLYATTEKKGEAAADSPFAKLLELKLGGKK